MDSIQADSVVCVLRVRLIRGHSGEFMILSCFHLGVWECRIQRFKAGLQKHSINGYMEH